MIRCDDAADVSQLRNIAYFLDLAPVPAAVFGYLKQAIIRADVDQPFLLWGFGKRRRIAEIGGRGIFRHRVHAPDFAHHRQPVAIEIARELTADDSPTIAAIIAPNPASAACPREI